MKNKILKYSIFYLAITLINFLIYYVTLPAINVYSPSFWVYLAFLIFTYLAPLFLIIKKREVVVVRQKRKGSSVVPFDYNIKVNKLAFVALVPIAVLIIGGIFSSSVFNARKYASVITVEESVFEEDMPETLNVTNIALMDTPSAQIVGNRTLGSLSDVVSQYEVSVNYNQINYQNLPKKVANLEYADFFKWMGNKDRGIPGYVMVDPVKFSAEYVQLKTPMKYVESAFFGEDLMRKLRFSYPTKIFGEPRYEVDDSGNPVYIVACYKPRVGLFGASDVNEVIIFNPCTGESELLSLDKVPEWVDIVFDGYLASDKYNWYGTLSGGFLNSVIGNQGCKKTTDDFGYIALDNDVWYFTGVTSVTGDESNIGFILTNARTGSYKYYPVIGAEEHSAMGAAEGEVQEKGYTASFPSLVNVYGEATYIMVLKDANGLVKLYALVNVEQYGIVATGDNQQQAMSEYKKLLAENGILSGSAVTDELKEVAVLSVTQTVIDGNTVFFYEASENGNTVYYKLSIADDESALFINAGDTIYLSCEETQTEGIYQILYWTKTKK